MVSDARLEELSFLSNLEKIGGWTKEKHAEDTPRRSMIAQLIFSGYLNGVEYFHRLGKDTAQSGDPRYLDRCYDGNRLRDIVLLLHGEEIEVRISHLGRVRRAELEQQLKANRQREPFGILLAKRHLETDLTIALLKASPESPVCLAVMDMNGLKAINDSTGHENGDAALKSYLQAVATVLDTRGEAYRGEGGDEVYAILPSIGVPEAAQIMRSVLKKLKNELLNFLVEARLNYLTASCGIASADDSAVTAADLMRRADEVQYQAKEASRGTGARPSVLALEGQEPEILQNN